MFSLTVVDHVRLDCDHVAQNYTVHARAAERLASLVSAVRIVLALLLAVATATCIGNLLFPTRPNQIAAVAASALALIGFALYSVAGVEGRVYMHRSFAHRLWLVAERYRSLITEIDDGLVDRAMLLHRRDDLIHQVHTIYEHGFGVDQPGYERARLSEPTTAGDRQVA
jgi:hypothetical protein